MASDGCLAPMGGDRLDGVAGWAGCADEEKGSDAMNFNLAVILTETAAASPDKPGGSLRGGQLTYARARRAVRPASGQPGGGRHQGRETPVALQLPNIPQFVVAYFGILKAGGVVVPAQLAAQGA